MSDLDRYGATLQGSEGERALETHIKQAGLPAPIREYQFAPPHKWRFDFAWPDQKVACEIEGGTWVKGRHTSGKGFEADCAKYAEALILGWRVLRVTTGQVGLDRAGPAVDWLARLLVVTALPEA